MEKNLQDNKQPLVKLEYQSKDINQQPESPDMDSVFGLFRTVSKMPTADLSYAIANAATHFYSVPVKFGDQMVIYKLGTTYRWCWYDALNREWRYATGS